MNSTWHRHKYEQERRKPPSVRVLCWDNWVFLKKLIFFWRARFWNSSFLKSKCSRLRCRDFHKKRLEVRFRHSRAKIVDASLCFQGRFSDFSFFNLFLKKLFFFGVRNFEIRHFWGRKVQDCDSEISNLKLLKRPYVFEVVVPIRVPIFYFSKFFLRNCG